MVELDTNELERMWKEAVMVKSDAVYYPDIRLEGLSKTIKATVRIGGIPAAIRFSRLYNKVRRVTD
jgi:hypothetical protein